MVTFAEPIRLKTITAQPSFANSGLQLLRLLNDDVMRGGCLGVVFDETTDGCDRHPVTLQGGSQQLDSC